MMVMMITVRLFRTDQKHFSSRIPASKTIAPKHFTRSQVYVWFSVTVHTLLNLTNGLSHLTEPNFTEKEAASVQLNSVAFSSSTVIQTRRNQGSVTLLSFGLDSTDRERERERERGREGERERERERERQRERDRERNGRVSRIPGFQGIYSFGPLFTLLVILNLKISKTIRLYNTDKG